jgi:hypothetical protein
MWLNECKSEADVLSGGARSAHVTSSSGIWMLQVKQQRPEKAVYLLKYPLVPRPQNKASCPPAYSYNTSHGLVLSPMQSTRRLPTYAITHGGGPWPWMKDSMAGDTSKLRASLQVR